MSYRFHRLILFGAFMLASSGCDAPSGTLQGKVMMGGKKLTSGSIVVHVFPEGNQNPRGIIAEDGTYVITNLPVGTYSITVHAHARMPEGMQLKQVLPPSDSGGPISPSSAASYSSRRPVSIPRKFSVPDESGISSTVKPGVQSFDIELK